MAARDRKDYFKQHYAKPEVKARLKAWGCKPETIARRRRNQRSKWNKVFGFPEGTVEALFAAALVCEMCGDPFAGDSSDRGNPLRRVVDHDHETEQFRGIIHQRCNIGIGNLDDREDLCLKAAAYLHTAKTAGFAKRTAEQ